MVKTATIKRNPSTSCISWHLWTFIFCACWDANNGWGGLRKGCVGLRVRCLDASLRSLPRTSRSFDSYRPPSQNFLGGSSGGCDTIINPFQHGRKGKLGDYGGRPSRGATERCPTRIRVRV